MSKIDNKLHQIFIEIKEDNKEKYSDIEIKQNTFKELEEQ